MLRYQIKQGQLVSLSYRVEDVEYNLNYLKESETVWNMFASLILAGDVDAATELYKLAFSIAACDNWTRIMSGHWNVQYAGHILYVRSDGEVQVFLVHANETSRVPKDLALKAAEIAYYIRRHRYERRVAETAKRNTRREYRANQSYRSRRGYQYAPYRTR